MTLSDREERILSQLEQQFDGPARPRRRNWRRPNPRLAKSWKGLAILVAGIVLVVLVTMLITVTLASRSRHSAMATPKQVALSASPHANTGGALRKGAAGVASGAKTASFTVAHPDFTGHGLCSSDPWVQGIASDAPFHPTAAGELAIALADEHQLPKN